MNIFQKGYHFLFPTYIHVLRKELSGVAKVLELGCGKGSPIRYVDKDFYSVGVDVYRPAIEQSKKAKIHDDYIESEIFSLDLEDNSFDCVIALDLIEHLTEENGVKLLELMERISSDKVIIFTPNGLVEQGEVDDNPFQKHLSGWSVDFFEKRKYEVFGINGLKFLRGERARIKWKPSFFWDALSMISQLLTFFMPSRAYQILAVRRK